jgi:transcriptional regulator with XRE-family HTH domain
MARTTERTSRIKFLSDLDDDGRRPFHPDELGSAVRRRRAELGVSQQDVRHSSGLSVTTISKIERGESDAGVQPATLRRLDAALSWPPGTASSYLSGHGGELDEERLAGADLDLVAMVVPRVLDALGAGTPNGARVMANLARLPGDIRRAVVDLLDVLATFYGSADPD